MRVAMIMAGAFMLLLAGCQGKAVQLSANEASAADFGPFPNNYQERAKASFETILKDPYSAHYSFADLPRKARVFKGLLYGAGHAYGWTFLVGVNAKNSFGGYTGIQYYRVLLTANGQAAAAPADQFGFFDYVADEPNAIPQYPPPK